jgi:hypothetical protein
VKPTQLDQVRDALRRETEQLQPVGLEIEDVKRRGGRRRNRSRALVAVATVTCLAGVGVAVTQRDSGGRNVVDIAAASSTPPPALQFRVVDGEIGFATHFTSSDGVTYALSTAPGVAANPALPGQAIYSTRDGETWTTADQHQAWISDLAVGGGVLYAIGTAPGEGNAVTYNIGTSDDGGQRWTIGHVPFTESTPNATVELSRSASVQVARSASATVALLTEQFFPNVDALVAARTAGHENVSINQTDAGIEMLDLGACAAAKAGAGADGSPTTISPPDVGQRLAVQGCDNPPSLGTITWSEMGLNSAADLVRQQLLVSTNGTDWSPGTAPETGFVTDIQASGSGFLLLADTRRALTGPVPGPQVTLMRSSDARSWTSVPVPGDVGVQSIAGDRIIGTDGNGIVRASADGGATWTSTDVRAQLPSASNAGVAMTDAGPLGFAIVANADRSLRGGQNADDYLLFSTDGVTWSTHNLATAGTPANAYPSQLTVGADHIAIDYQESNGPDVPMKTKTVLATPTR